MYPTFMFHPVLAPSGRIFTNEAELAALTDQWVDSPAKFPPAAAEAANRSDDPDPVALMAPRRRRGRPPTTEEEVTS